MSEWKNAAVVASNLSQFELTLGDIATAVRDAEQSVGFADRSGNAFERLVDRAALADALHQAGRRDEALKRFREAESMQAGRQPEYPRLTSLQGFQYCDLLLAGAERAAAGAGSGFEALREELDHVERRTQETIETRHPADSMLDIALDHLTLGRVHLYRALLDGTAVSDAESEIEQAVDWLRRAGTLHHQPKGLLTRAWLRFAQDRPDDARADLDAAEEIARRGPMPLFLADIALYRARFFQDRDALAVARRLIDKHSYGRRLEEIAALEASMAGA
jgi:tetratricopeptide (TPR) repeat protein